MISFKRGDTFERTVTLRDENRDPVTVDEIKCQVRDIDLVLIEELSVVETATSGTYTLSSANTETYPIGPLQMDIEIVLNGIKKSSNTISIEVVQDITYV